MCTALLVLVAVPAVFCQTGGGTNPGPRVIVSSESASPQGSTNGEVVREIDDPNSGARWILSRDASHPGGPGRMVLVGGLRSEAGSGTRKQEPGDALSLTVLKPVIRTGDRLILEENSAVVEARLEAVALGPAAVGSPLKVRLTIGGKVVRALALGPGRVTFQPGIEVEP